MNSFLVTVYNTYFIACQPSSSQRVDYPTMDFILPKSNFEVMIPSEGINCFSAPQM